MDEEYSSVHRIQIGDYTLDKSKKLGSGGFGDIYFGVNKYITEGVAIKLESFENSSAILIDEARRYKDLQGEIGIPKLYWYGNNDKYNIMIMELLGKNLEDLRHSCGGKLNLKTVTLLSYQMINRLEFVHSKEYIHRDIKPDNFVMGIGKHKDILYLIDFGLSKRYREMRSGRHIPFRDGKSMIGTARFASLNTHYGYEQSRRDDLESLAYVLIYLLKGSLPWQGLQSKNRNEKFEKIMKVKENTSISELCGNLPLEFEYFFSYIKNLKFEEAPDYSYLKGLMTKVIVNEKFTKDQIYCWSKNDEVINKIT